MKILVTPPTADEYFPQHAVRLCRTLLYKTRYFSPSPNAAGPTETLQISAIGTCAYTRLFPLVPHQWHVHWIIGQFRVHHYHDCETNSGSCIFSGGQQVCAETIGPNLCDIQYIHGRAQSSTWQHTKSYLQESSKPRTSCRTNTNHTHELEVGSRPAVIQERCMLYTRLLVSYRCCSSKQVELSSQCCAARAGSKKNWKMKRCKFL